jgi:hypothetical protein
MKSRLTVDDYRALQGALTAAAALQAELSDLETEVASLIGETEPEHATDLVAGLELDDWIRSQGIELEGSA